MTRQYINEAYRLFFSGLNEIVGRKELARLLETDTNGAMPGGPSEDESAVLYLREKGMSRLQARMEKQFGRKELQGLLLRSGRASCKFFVRQYGPEMQVTSTEYRLLPTKKRLLKGLKAAAGLCAELFHKEISVVEEGDYWIWQETQPDNETASDTNCPEFFFTIGLLQEYLAWLSGGKTFQVKRAETGGNFEGLSRLAISKQPVE
jgi:hypothetical protein